jgi:hypothetical protein
MPSNKTNKDIDRISRSWAGHLATNPDVRAQMNDVLDNGTDEDMADLINQTVVPKDNVHEDDVPAIKAKTNTMLQAQDLALHQTNLQHAGLIPPNI